MKILPMGAELFHVEKRRDGQTDRQTDKQTDSKTKLIVTFRSFANAPKISLFIGPRHLN